MSSTRSFFLVALLSTFLVTGCGKKMWPSYILYCRILLPNRIYYRICIYFGASEEVRLGSMLIQGPAFESVSVFLRLHCRELVFKRGSFLNRDRSSASVPSVYVKRNRNFLYILRSPDRVHRHVLRNRSIAVEVGSCRILGLSPSEEHMPCSCWLSCRECLSEE